MAASVLNGARNIDLHFSPFTNTLAIRRLALEKGESAQTQVVFIVDSKPGYLYIKMELL
ncbi:MAG: hypothetical protein FH748_14070 [Balneolaceae bacterium]|nr:hypothetical protein [Balneolaceae bacterium]